MTSLSLAAILAEAARRRPDHIALVEGDLRIGFADLWHQARVQAATLIRIGVRPGDRVALMAPNTAEFPRAYYAILATGAVVVPVHLLLTSDETAYVLRDSGAKLLLCHDRHRAVGERAARATGVRMLTIGRSEEAGEPVPNDMGIAAAEGVAGAEGVKVAGAEEVGIAGVEGPAEVAVAPERLEELGDAVEPMVGYATRAPEDPAVVFYTSGTTGAPKGAVLSHLNLVMNATVSAFDANHALPDDIALGALPLFHAFGQTVSMNSTWRVGATLVLLPRFDPVTAIALMVAEGVNTFHGVPTMYISLVEAARTAPALPELRLCLSGGASLPATVLERFQAAFGAVVYEGYGLSETSPTASVNQEVFGARPGTVGHAVWGVDVEIARAETEDAIELLAPGESGEIVVRGHNVFTGYLNRPEATAEALVDGWFRTGDLGIKDADGYVTIIDRKKDIVIRGGFNVYPREIEEVLLRHPAIAQAAVIGLPDRLLGEEICAVIVLAPTTDPPPTEAELITWARDRMGRHKYPRRVEFVTELPLGPSHKVLKRELRARFGG
ncbi:long-chain fatty acid--CoA ligase (plasmid) [Embleya sp. NBC_00888]|uniref:long-chain-fatty-acid--CoA ligase n=1 Tax=Embleya sp. NBC_00888 TaxID=2975960 RepID=UPI002F90A569|nr:long-chain fatty acid--CoA ligase [Embleya sp. NBC_00888]